jgi:aspartyl-tRNA(Asn)/glutamyl-tRNA(Gln) amidotransferase subunit A
MKLHEMPVHELAGLLKSRDVGARELAQAYLERIGRYQPDINCFVTVTPEVATAQADEAQKRLDSGYAGPLTGIPMAFKDNMCTKGVRTTCASRMLENFTPPYSATVVDRLNKAGIVMLGKLNMDEFAMGSSNENSYFGPVRNPWNRERVSGGSSGGSAAAVSAALASFTLGSDTGGSIRLPASFCGVVGMKPTYGAVSRFGLVAFASSLDQIGPITTNVRDCAWVLDAIVGHDPMDSTSAQVAHESCVTGLESGVRDFSIGLADEYFGAGLNSEVKAAVLRAVAALESQGAGSGRCSVPATEYGISAYYLLSSAEASANLARFDGIRYGHRSPDATDMRELYRLTRGEGFGREVKNRILLGTHALSSGYHDALYVKALKVRRMIHDDFAKAFETHDVLVSPCAPTTAFRLGEKTADPLTMYLGDVYTVAVNLAGLPALTVPCGLDADGMPIGVQLIGKPFSEKKLLQAGYAIEQALGCFVSPLAADRGTEGKTNGGAVA